MGIKVKICYEMTRLSQCFSDLKSQKTFSDLKRNAIKAKADLSDASCEKLSSELNLA